AREISRKVRINLGHCLAQSRAQRFGSLFGTRANNDCAKLGGGRGAEQWHVKSGGLGLLIERALHQSVRDNPDNRSPRWRLTGIKDPDLMTDCALVSPIFSSK